MKEFDIIIDEKKQAELEDDILNDISASLSNLQGMSNEIHKTLDYQDKMLTVLDDEMDEAQTFTNINIKKIDRLLSPNQSKACCVVFLLLIAICILLLVIYL